MWGLYFTFREQVRLSVFEENMLQGGYLDVNRGSDNKSGWNSIIESFVISKLPNSLNKMGEILWVMMMQLTCMEEEGVENLAENIQKKIFIRKISSETEEHKHNTR